MDDKIVNPFWKVPARENSGGRLRGQGILSIGRLTMRVI
jgi:hypothetical protein